MDYVGHFCAKDCPDTCGFKAKVEDGELFVEPSVDWGFLDKPFVCRKLKFFFEREARSGAFSFVNGKKASDETVMDEIARLLKGSKDKRILYYRGSGNLGYSMFGWDILMSQFDNVYFVDGSPCDETGIEAHIEDFGVCKNPDIEELERAETIIIFGKNAFVCSPHLYAVLKKLRDSKHIIYIDPVRTKTSSLAHEYFQINPGMDGVLANALLNFLAGERLLTNDPAHLTGLSEEEIEFLADSIKSGGTAFIEGYGLQRYRNGKNTIKWLNKLAYETGNIDKLFYSRSSKEGLKKPEIDIKNRVFISDVSTLLEQGFFDMIFIVASNPVMSLPDSHIWAKSIKDKTAVVIDTNFTQSSENADYFLKVGGMFASKDVQGSYFFNKLFSKEPVLEGLSDLDAAKEIGKRLGVSVELTLDCVPRVQVPERVYRERALDLSLPDENLRDVRFITLPHPSYLNSQTEQVNSEQIYISNEIASLCGIVDGDSVWVDNGGRKALFKCRVSNMVKGRVAFSYKGRYDKVNFIIDSKPTDTKRGIAYNETFLTLKKKERG